MRTRNAIVVVLLFLVSCQPWGGRIHTPSPGPSASATRRKPSPTAAVTTARTTRTAETEEPLEPLAVDLSKPFSDVQLTQWEESEYAGMDYTLPVSLSAAANPHVIDGLTGDERSFLVRNGFVVIHSQENQFSALRSSVDGGQPYFLTVDAAYHALHQNFDDTLKELERQYIRKKIRSVLQATLDELAAGTDRWRGTSLEMEGTQSVAYLSVALKLLDPEFEPDPSVRDAVDGQIAQIDAAGGWGSSSLFPDFRDDYGAYKPVGHYAGDPDLEQYFRAMTWLGRVHFLMEDSRVPLVITMALRRAKVEGWPAWRIWGDIHRILDFIVGPSDDAGPMEYAGLMDQVYGPSQTYAMLADDALWRAFVSRKGELPAPQINSLFVLSTEDLAFEAGWRFMGQRFTIDAFVFQNLIHDRVKGRFLPTGLDVMAVLGSSTARTTLTELKLDDYPEYDGRLAKLIQGTQDQPEAQWTNRFYDSWLYSFFPLLGPKGDAYPAFMTTEAWGYKDMNTGLGSWAELKHDTVLYTKMPEGAGGGGPPGSDPAPAYVEPDPNAFYRMAYAANSLSQGLMRMDAGSDSDGSAEVPLSFYLARMADLGEQFENLGDIAVKEIRGEPIDGYYAIWSCMGYVECSPRTGSEDPPMAVVAAVSGSGDVVLEAGVGFVDRIFVVVPLEGALQIAQGGVFSYYEFTQPRDDRLTDQQWREVLLSGDPPEMPAWAPKFVFQGGGHTHWTVFRTGDWYMVTDKGDGVKLRGEPSASAAVLAELRSGYYINIVGGPVQAGGYTWWKIDNSFNPGADEGWVAENQEWYVRV